MSLDIILGAQWGDEGKGRFTDLLAAEADIVARFSGGDNAGHTVTIGKEVFKLHLIPSGIIHDQVVALIGNGVVVNPATLLREMGGLAERGIDVGPARLQISQSAHLITPAHVALDRAEEESRGSAKIGTTLRGIGPAYMDKTGRFGLRAGLLRDPERLADQIHEHIIAKNKVLVNVYDAEPLDPDAIAAQFVEYAQRLGSHVVDSTRVMGKALDEEQNILGGGSPGHIAGPRSRDVPLRHQLSTDSRWRFNRSGHRSNLCWSCYRCCQGIYQSCRQWPLPDRTRRRRRDPPQRYRHKSLG